MSAEEAMNLRKRVDEYFTERVISYFTVDKVTIEQLIRAELLRAADAVANMHGESATKIAAYLRAQAE